MSNQWYILRDGQIVGPYSPTEIREQAKLGNIQPTTRICRDLKGAWVKAAKVQGLDFSVQNVSEPAQWSDPNEVAFPPPPPLPLAHIQYPPPPPIPNAKPNYPSPPPLPVIHSAQGNSGNEAIKEHNTIDGSGTKEIELESTGTRPWYLKELGILFPLFIGWFLFKGGCQTLFKDDKKRNPPPKVQQVQAVPAATIPIVRSVGEFAGTQDEQH